MVRQIQAAFAPLSVIIASNPIASHEKRNQECGGESAGVHAFR